MITKAGKNEGTLNLIAWEGYTYKQWVTPFTKRTGCKVHSKYGGSSDEMVTLMRTGQYDAVSASGDASLRLILGKDVRPIDPKLVPDYKNFIQALKSPPHNTVKGVHYGISLQWGPNTLMYNTKKVKPKPTTWGLLYSSKYKGKITVPDNPIQIADAALYLSKTKPALGIKDPYELTDAQFKAAKAPVADLIPKEGATGWADTWMISSKAKHPNCAVSWIKWVSTPTVQAQQAIYFGETPANTKACAIMDKLSKGSCAQYHGNAPAAYFNSIKFWKTPVKACGNGQNNCVDYTKWQQAWTDIKS